METTLLDTFLDEKDNEWKQQLLCDTFLDKKKIINGKNNSNKTLV